MWPIYRRHRYFYQTHVTPTDGPVLGPKHGPGPDPAFLELNPQPLPPGYEYVALNPQPIPPDPSSFALEIAIQQIIELASLKQLADKKMGSQIDGKISSIIDEYCGNNLIQPPVPTPHYWPFRWHWPVPDPGPLDNIYSMASALVLTANTLHEGGLKNELVRIGGQVYGKAADLR